MRKWAWGAIASGVVFAIAGLITDRSFRNTVARSLPTPPTVDNSKLFADPTLLVVTITAAGRQAPWPTTIQELRSSAAMWRRMHFADWNGVPAELRREAFGRMLLRYARLLNTPAAWDEMAAVDWDDVPQPIRAVAFRRMVAYWSGYYDVGRAHGLSSAVVAQTLSAIVMSESWFDHRARSPDRDDGVDIGLAQASPYARERIRQLHARQRVDVTLADDDYLDPWKATRFVALWMSLMLDESNDDLDTAIRAYHRGSSDAADRLGTEYLATINRRLSRFIRNQDAPAAWDDMWRLSRSAIRAAPAPQPTQP
ncbi:MAG: transglycosylase SLT domain-containing protein [Vicinamibacterales bacterium]